MINSQMEGTGDSTNTVVVLVTFANGEIMHARIAGCYVPTHLPVALST